MRLIIFYPPSGAVTVSSLPSTAASNVLPFFVLVTFMILPPYFLIACYFYLSKDGIHPELIKQGYAIRSGCLNTRFTDCFVLSHR